MGYLAELAGASDPVVLDPPPTTIRPPAPTVARRHAWIFVIIAAVAFGVRLVPVLSHGGLYALASYDGSVYYTAAAGLAHGYLPYRDFLLLHPPGITLALLPFALVGQHFGDAQGLAAARVAWMALGAVNAVLVSRILRPVGLAAALVGGMFYAVFVPALRIERVTSLEAVAATCILGALLIASRWQRGVRSPVRSALLVGVLLGFSAGVKIWGVAVVVVLVVWALRVAGVRRALTVAAGAVVGASAICLPFFLAAPSSMWRMVVLDQVGRHRTSRSIYYRVTDLAGLHRSLTSTTGLVVAAIAVVVVVASALALRTRPGRLGVVVLAATLILLFSTPTWFLHYSGLSAAPLAIVVGAAAGVVIGWIRLRPLRAVAVAAVLAALGAYALSAPVSSSGKPFPARSLAAGLTGVTGCVTADDPSALIELNVLQRNFTRHCPVMADLGGYSYDLHGPGNDLSRRHDRAWQQHLISYLSTGRAAILIRFHQHSGLSAASVNTIHHWSVLSRAGKFVLRDPAVLKTHKVRAR